MEEVDKIIIDSLKHLDCGIEEETTSLKDFDPDLVVAAISTCLETMNPQLKLPKKLPSSMSAKIKTASNLARQIKELGFKGDMGYQTVLYCNEVEVRRVLMFLIERLPKETSQITSLEPMGYVPRIVKQIEESLQISLNKMWFPSEALYFGTRETSDSYLINSFGNSCLLDTVNLVVPCSNSTDEDTEFYKYIPEVTKQCSSTQLIPSLLFSETEFPSSTNWSESISQTLIKKDLSTDILGLSEVSHSLPIENSSKFLTEVSKEKDEDNAKTENINRNAIDALLEKLKEKKDAYISLQEVVNSYENQLDKIKSIKLDEQTSLKDTIGKVKVRNKTLTVLNTEENKVKLKKIIQKTENRLIELANQWNEVQSPLLEECKVLKTSVSSESLKLQDDQAKLHNFKRSFKDMMADFKEKSVLEQNLMERCKEINNKNNRAAYTKRILEIVGNIKKQNNEIQRVLTDTRLVQKDISNLTGQVDRSFTMSDELIFSNCMQDETSRKAYKLLAALREECNGILKAVSDLGQAERELRNLEEQVETEKNKEIKIKLEKVLHDLTEIKKEIELLL